MPPVFFLYHYNDIDHVTPIVWRCLQEGHEVHVVLLNPDLSVDDDPRIQFIQEKETIEVHRIQELLGPLDASWPFRTEGDGIGTEVRRKARALLRRSGFTAKQAVAFLEDVDADVTVFEWGGRSSRGRRELIDAAGQLGLPRICVPHGLNIFLNFDLNPRRTRFSGEGTPFAERWIYDEYVYQSEHHRDQEARLGLPEDCTSILGSARYAPEWQEINLEIHPTYELKGSTGDRTRLVFMLPHWDFYVDKEATMELIDEFVGQEWLHVVVKTHTRGSGGFPEERYRRLRDEANFELAIEPPSVSLIEWGDVVVNFGSSIGIEALMQGTPLVNPSYLHDNRTIFEATGACHETQDTDATLARVRALHDGEASPVSEKAKEKLYRKVVYGGREPHDVLATYLDLIGRYADRPVG